MRDEGAPGPLTQASAPSGARPSRPRRREELQRWMALIQVMCSA